MQWAGIEVDTKRHDTRRLFKMLLQLRFAMANLRSDETSDISKRRHMWVVDVDEKLATLLI